MRSLSLWLPAALLLAVLCSVPTHVSAAEWQAGVAKAKITPRQPMWMSGYGSRDHRSEGTLTDLWTKVVVLQDERGERVVLVSLDLVGIPRDIAQKICAALKQMHGLERRQIAFFCSHTHTGPMVGSNLATMFDLKPEDQALVDEYALELQANILGAVTSAIEKLAPSRLSWANGHATFAVNRRTNMEAAVPQVRVFGALNGPVDYDVPVLAVRSLNGELRAIIFGYACHSTVLSFYQWSGDYPGFAQIELEKAHPEAVALFFAGCGADQNPLPRREVAIAEKYGKMLATEVDAVINGVMPPVKGVLRAHYEEVPLPFDTLPTLEKLQADTKEANVYVARRAKALLKQIEAGQPLSPTYPYPVQLWRLGDLQWVTLGGEVVVDYSLRIKRELGREHTWVAGYTNDVMAYIPSARVLKEGGYEGGGAMLYYGLPTIWGPAVEDTLMKGVHGLAGQP